MKTKINYLGKKIDIHYPEELKEDVESQKLEIIRDEQYKPGIKKDGVYIDLGANIGMATRYFAPYAKKIYSIEPNPKIYEYLVKNTKELLNVKTFNFAMSYFDGEDFLYSHRAEDLPQTLFGNVSAVNAIKVKTKTFKTFFEENNIDHVDTLKIDIEGGEYITLPSKGFEEVADKIDFIVGESHVTQSGGLPEAIPVILKDYGFKTKYLKLDNPNYFRSLTFVDNYTGIKKVYKVLIDTIFVASR